MYKDASSTFVQVITPPFVPLARELWLDKERNGSRNNRACSHTTHTFGEVRLAICPADTYRYTGKPQGPPKRHGRGSGCPHRDAYSAATATNAVLRTQQTMARPHTSAADTGSFHTIPGTP